jgi:hypothetical protein
MEPRRENDAMTALLAVALSGTISGMGSATSLHTWSLMEPKKSPKRNATSTAVDLRHVNYRYCSALKFVIEFDGVAVLSIVDPVPYCERDGARA